MEENQNKKDFSKQLITNDNSIENKDPKSFRGSTKVFEIIQENMDNDKKKYQKNLKKLSQKQYMIKLREESIIKIENDFLENKNSIDYFTKKLLLKQYSYILSNDDKNEYLKSNKLNKIFYLTIVLSSMIFKYKKFSNKKIILYITTGTFLNFFNYKLFIDSYFDKNQLNIKNEIINKTKNYNDYKKTDFSNYYYNELEKLKKFN